VAEALRIRKEKPRIDVRHALDLLGASFKGDHVGGMAEWLKNAVDAYIREDTPDAEQYIVVHLKLPARRTDWVFECVDFVGASYEEINEDLMMWCDPNAASKGGKFEVYGGHGNGGKFHMRENFREAEFMTYRDGLLTAFAFEDKDYGFDQRYKGAAIEPAKAIKIAGLDLAILPKPVRERFERGDVTFTLVRGIGPLPAPKWKDWREFKEKLQRHGQSKQLLDRVPTTIAVNGKIEILDLDAPKIPAKPGFEQPVVKDIPGTLSLDGEQVKFTKDGSSPGKLTLRTAAEPFANKGADSALNAIDIRGKVGVIASYRIMSLGIRNVIGGQFIYGECHCPVLEQLGCKENDRKQLAENDYSQALLHWIGEEVDRLAAKLIEKQDKEKMDQYAAVTRRFNALLNKWKNRFLEKLFIEVSGGPGIGAGFGGTGGGGNPEGKGGGGGGGKGRAGEGGDDGGGAGDEKKKAPKFPLVLISGQDNDPETDEPVMLDPRQEVIYQRPGDTAKNIWWINGQRPLADRLLAGGPTSERWRDYLLQRYIDIIQTYVLGQRWKEAVDASPDDVTQWMLETIGRIQDSATRDLEDFMFGAAGGGNGEQPPA